MATNIELEKDLLGCMMHDTSIIVDVADILVPEDFSSERTRLVLQAIIDLNDEGVSIDQEIINFRTDQKLTQLICESYDRVRNGSNWEKYAHKIRDLSIDFQFKSILRTALEKTPGSDIIESLSSISDELQDLMDKTGGKGISQLHTLIAPVLAEMEVAFKRKSNIVGFDSKFDEINERMGGIRKEYIVIGARPSIGKSALAAQIGLNLAMQDIGVLMFCLEQRDIDLVMRMLSAESGVSAEKLQSGFMKISDFQSIQDAASRLYTTSKGSPLSHLPFYFCDSTYDIDEMLAKARYMIRKKQVQVVIFDHMSIIDIKDADRLQDFQKMTKISKKFQRFQRRMKCTVIALAQLGRDAEATKHKEARPTIADLRGSGSVEQDADQIWLMHRDRNEENNDTDTDVQCAKGRNGGKGIAKLLFKSDTVKFFDRPKGVYDKDKH